MPSILTAERETYQDIWALPTYGEYAPGEKYADQFVEMVAGEAYGTVLDACSMPDVGLAKVRWRSRDAGSTCRCAT
jgi:hypothetical protein